MASDTISVTRFALLRQAEAEVNKTKRVLGQNNNSLTAEDEEQAKKWGKVLRHFQFDRILTSEKGPSRETAEIVNLMLGVPVMKDPRLREQDWGRWTGKTLEQITTEEPELLQEQDEACWGFTPPEGEELNAVLNRSLIVLKEAYKEYPQENILVVANDGIIKNIISYLLENMDPDDDNKKISGIYLTNQLHRVFCYDGGIKIDAMNSLPLP